MGGGYVRVGVVVVSREPGLLSVGLLPKLSLIASEQPGVLFIIGWDNAGLYTVGKVCATVGLHGNGKQRGKENHRGQIFHRLQSCFSRVCALVLWCDEAQLTKGAGLERRVGPGCRQISMATVWLRRSLRGPGREAEWSGGVRGETLRAPEGGDILSERNRNTGGARAAVKGRGVWQSEKRSFKIPRSLAHELRVWQMGG